MVGTTGCTFEVSNVFSFCFPCLRAFFLNDRKNTEGWWLRGRILGFGSRGPGFESMAGPGTTWGTGHTEQGYRHGLRYRVGRVGYVPTNIFTLALPMGVAYGPMGVAWKESDRLRIQRSRGSNPWGTGRWGLAASPWLRKKIGDRYRQGSATGWDGWDTSQPIYLLFNTTPMGVAWKESTPEGLRPPQYSEDGGAPGYRISPSGGRPVMDWCLDFECY